MRVLIDTKVERYLEHLKTRDMQKVRKINDYLEKLKNTENPTALPHKKSDCKHYKSSFYHGLVFYSWIMEDYKIVGVEMYESGEIIIRLITKMTQKEIQERYEHMQYLKCFNRLNDLYEVGIKDFAYEMPKE